MVHCNISIWLSDKSTLCNRHIKANICPYYIVHKNPFPICPISNRASFLAPWMWSELWHQYGYSSLWISPIFHNDKIYLKTSFDQHNLHGKCSVATQMASYAYTQLPYSSRDKHSLQYNFNWCIISTASVISLTQFNPMDIQTYGNMATDVQVKCKHTYLCVGESICQLCHIVITHLRISLQKLCIPQHIIQG